MPEKTEKEGSSGGETVAVSDLVARALYNPDSGYYTRHIATVGARGDFSTSATLGRALGAAVAAWAVAAWRESGNRATSLIEIGPGTGALACDIRRRLPPCHPLRRHHHLVEISPVLRAQQERMLGSRVRWHERIESALDACDGHALILGHELIDAFPPELVRWNGSAWERIALHLPATGTVEWRALAMTDALRPKNHAALDPMSWPGGTPPTGQILELFDSARKWLADWLPRWQNGQLLWIDYGDHFPALYHRRPGGTLRAYFRHQRLEGIDVFRRLGRQDITADVNFTDLRRWGEQSGLHTLFDGTQREFIARHLLPHTLTRHAADPALAPDPSTAFRALIQHAPPA